MLKYYRKIFSDRGGNLTNRKMNFREKKKKKKNFCLVTEEEEKVEESVNEFLKTMTTTITT